MSSTTAPKADKATADKSKTTGLYKPLMVLLPHIILLAAQLPLLFMYYRDLWGYPHYRFFPFAFIAFGMFIALRWPVESRSPYIASLFSTILFWMGIGFGVLGTLFLYPWFTALSAMLLVTSLLARTKDKTNPDRSLISTSLPLWITLAPPFNYDQLLITKLQLVSASISSNYLDLMGYKHYLPGTVLQFPGQQYEVEQACSGVQSFFTLMFCAAFFIVLSRRAWFRGLLLLLAAGVWAVFMNSMRIVLIPVADQSFGINLKDGIAHDLLGYAVLSLAILLLLSTDQFLSFLFGPVESDALETGHPLRRAIAKFWNRTLASENAEDEREKRKKRRRNTRPSMAFRLGAWACVAIFVLTGTMQAWDVQKSLANPNLKVQFFSTVVILPFEESDLPENLTNQVTLPSAKPGQPERTESYRWIRGAYGLDNRSRGSDLGQRSDTWNYQSGNGRLVATVSLDQTFPGWHELTVCYQNDGYTLLSRKVRTVTIKDEEGEEVEWPYVEAEFEHKTRGDKPFLVFAFTDGMGIPYDAPRDWSGLNAFFQRAKNRLAHQYRKRVFRGEAYQMQTFARTQGGAALDDAAKEEVRQQFLKFRGILREKLIEKSLDSKSNKETVADSSQE